jgi:hypothetical protein
LNNSTNQFSLNSLGWRFIFIYAAGTAGRPSTPVLVPNTVPKDSEFRDDLALAAMVILPESDGNNQYWIPVTEQHRFALLETKDWTIIVQRDPLTLSAL